MAKGKTCTPLLLKPTVENTFCNRIATLLVPLASADGSPIKIKRGIISKDPPPASVFIIPAKTPEATKMMASINVKLG